MSSTTIKKNDNNLFNFIFLLFCCLSIMILILHYKHQDDLFNKLSTINSVNNTYINNTYINDSYFNNCYSYNITDDKTGLPQVVQPQVVQPQVVSPSKVEQPKVEVEILNTDTENVIYQVQHARTFLHDYITGTNMDINYDYSKARRQVTINNIDFCNSVTGLSMAPTLFQGNTVCYTEYKTNIKLSPGMIVLVDSDTKRYVHRIIAVYKDYVITQGDNNPTDDGKINKTDISHIANFIMLT